MSLRSYRQCISTNNQTNKYLNSHQKVKHLIRKNVFTIIGLTETIAMIDRSKALIPKKQRGRKAIPLAMEYACLAPIFLKAG